MGDWQFYPTPCALAERAWSMFSGRRVIRLLEPSAGRGDLVLGSRLGYPKAPVDVIEIDIRHHPILKERGFSVIGTDFLQSQSLAQYSHIIMNPPFNAGAAHVLHAFDRMLQGEIVAIVNAETLRNPHTRGRDLLLDIIARCGRVEYVDGAFAAAERKTGVEVALIHLRKETDASDIVQSWVSGLERAQRPADPQEVGGQLALPRAEVENLVIAYNAAVEASTEAALATRKREYYKSLLGATVHEQSGGTEVEAVQVDIAEQVQDLRSRAWAGVLYRTSIADKLSTKAGERLRAEFAEIERLEFTLGNIRAFVSGILQSQGDIQIEMMCDVFDLVTKYHTGNRVHYKGWKSNDQHQQNAYRMKAKRFVLPLGGGTVFGLRLDAKRTLDDIDKVFCLLDGKSFDADGETMARAFDSQYGELRDGERVQTRYFDVRFYPGAGTVHFFPRRRDLVDRLNRLVGAQRAWLPPEGETVNDAFWLQYDRAAA